MGAGQTRAKTVRDADDTILELGGSYTPTGTWNWSAVTWSNVPALSYVPSTWIVQAGANNVLTYTGNYTLGFTLTGNTSITFPTTGTLATTAQLPTAASLHMDDILTTIGVASEALHLGTFTGSTIPDNQPVKPALQALETSLELKAATSSLATDNSTASHLIGKDSDGHIENITLQGLTLSGTTSPILTVTSLTPVIDDPDNFAANFTGANLYGGTFIANAAGTAALPDPTVGMNFTYILEGANANIIDPLGTGTADTIVMNGLAATADENITSSTSGAMCVFQYRAANSWMATCNGFAEATPP